MQQLQTPSGTYARHSGPGLLLRAFRTLFMRPGVSSPSLHIAPAPQSFYFLPALAKSQFSIGPWGVGTHTSLPRQACCYQCTSGLSTPGAGGFPPVLSSPVLRTHKHQGVQQTLSPGCPVAWCVRQHSGRCELQWQRCHLCSPEVFIPQRRWRPPCLQESELGGGILRAYDSLERPH